MSQVPNQKKLPKTVRGNPLLIKGISWKITVLSNQSYDKKFGEDHDSAGTTEFDPNMIFIKEDSLQLDVIIHEMGHAYFHSCLTDSASLKPIQVEELFCEILAHHGAEIITKSRQIYKYLTAEIRNHNAAE